MDTKRHAMITGGSGFIGSALAQRLLADGWQVTLVTRNPQKLSRQRPHLECVSLEQLVGWDKPIDLLVNLAGAAIADRRWSEGRKQLLRDSRVGYTKSLLAALENCSIGVFISGSAIGYYGSRDDERLGESACAAPGFTHSLCRDWEDAALQAEAQGARVCHIRTGVVLGRGGALAKMLPPFKFGLGGPIASGKQWMSWIHLEDQLAAIEFLAQQPSLSGAFNLTAPQPVTNQQFSELLAATLRRPAKLRMPAWVIELMLGEGAELLVKGQRVVPERLLEAGFEFRFAELSDAFTDILHR